MNVYSRENEDTLQKLEKIRNICLNALTKVDNLLVSNSLNPNLNCPIEKDKILEDITFISHNLSTAMELCDPLFKHYIAIPAMTEKEDLPYYLMSMKNDSLVQYEKKLLSKSNYNEDEDNLMDIDLDKENENKIKSNISKLSRNLLEMLTEYRKKNKMFYINNTNGNNVNENIKAMFESKFNEYKKMMHY